MPAATTVSMCPSPVRFLPAVETANRHLFGHHPGAVLEVSDRNGGGLLSKRYDDRLTTEFDAGTPLFTGTRASMTVPWPGAERTLSSPPIERTRSRMLTSPRPSTRWSATNPTPPSWTVNTSTCRSPVIVTCADVARLCLTTLASAAWTMRKTHRPTSLDTGGTASSENCTSTPYSDISR